MKKRIKLRCRIILETWYQETAKENHFETLPNIFESIDEALEYLSLNYNKILNDYPVVGLKIAYE